MTTLPQISSYGRYDSGNYGAHTLKVDLGKLILYYSYETIVAYKNARDGLVCSVNQWGTTTGKHLNWIEPNKKDRIEADLFDEMLKSAIKLHIS